ncbi:GtrA family protein [Capillimicrobium parvum]|uniref:GtrA/DPMS transmembrane domain-containing protein n=1 Tax=Capillimicrobium parvum TaxID=2884022 RepID=A0A9E7C090_9ACTN|nr:GtrA family protein [Capillimicrobium parvum]UGS36121.1 hypothetical protein DSM104329_02521 [Capillimicrobium parvum]
MPRSPSASLLLTRDRASLSQFARFCVVGTSGFVVSLVTFALLLERTGIDYRAADALAFLVAVANNFVWNRRWTFATARAGAVGQASRFLVVSVMATALSLAILTGLVAALHADAIAAQAAATIAVTPLSFMGNRRWAFAAGSRPRQRPHRKREPAGGD